MKKIFTLLILSFAFYKASGQVAIGSEGGILPLGSYPAYYNQYLKGGFKSGSDVASRDAYPVNMRDTQSFIFYTTSDATFWVLQGGLTNEFWVKLNIGGASSSLPGGAVFPSSPAEGDTFFLNTDKHLYVYNGTAWVAIDNALPSGQFYIGDVNGVAAANAKNTIPISGFDKAASDIAMGDGTGKFKITNMADPVDDHDATTKKYVDAVAGLAKDNLGDHTAAQNLKMGSFSLSNDGDAGDGLTFDTDGNAYFGKDVTVNYNMLTPSDQRLKTNVETLGNVLQSIERMRGVRFEYINQHKYAKGPKIGVIAQELRNVYPELVTMGTDGFYKVDYTQLTGILIQAVKEQQAQVMKLKQELEELKIQAAKQQDQINIILKKLE